MKIISKARLAPVILLCLRFVAVGAPPHPVHFTTTTIEYNDATQTVEVRIEIYGEGFEYAIKKYAGPRVSLKLAAAGHGERGMNAVREYLNEKFVLQDGNGGRMRLKLENPEEKDDWYVMELKARAPAGLAGARLRNLLLFELQEEDHVNNVVTKYRGKEIKLAFHDKDEFKVITEQPERNCPVVSLTGLERRKKENVLSGSETMIERNRLDRLGAAASLACAAHCVATPLLVGLLPLVGQGFLASEQTEWALAGLSLGIGSLSLLPSYARKHRQWRPLLLFAFGAGLIIAVRLSAEEGSRLEAPTMALGALLIACAHLVNRRLCRSCVACHPAGE